MIDNNANYARHRAEGRATTPLTSMGSSAGRFARRGTAVVAGVGVALTLGVSSASASAPVSEATYAGGGGYSTQPVSSQASSSAVVNLARQHVGTPYVWGGGTPAGFDCSGFVQYVFAQAGIDLPRTSGAQAAAGYRISASEARPGDLVWWPGHIGIYTGDGNHIAARSPGTALHEGPIHSSNPTYIRVSG